VSRGRQFYGHTINPETRGSHAGVCEDYYLLECDTFQSRRSLRAFRRNLLLPLSGSKSDSMKPNIEEMNTSEKPGKFYQTTWYHIPDDNILHTVNRLLLYLNTIEFDNYAIFVQIESKLRSSPSVPFHVSSSSCREIMNWSVWSKVTSFASEAQMKLQKFFKKRVRHITI
jgi:hypothetical protein